MSEVNEMNYGAEEIQVLEGLDAVRKRPGMYIGSTDERGLHHIVYEVVDNSVDEALAGYGDHILVTIHKDGSITVRDHGRGIPVDMHKSGKPALEVVLTELHAGGKFGNGAYKVAGGLHGVGASCTNALSTWMTARVYRDGKIHEMKFKRGKVVENLKVVGDTDETGTEISFLPDDTVFETVEFDYKTLRHRFREQAFLNKNLTIQFVDERVGESEDPVSETYHFEGGIVTFVEEVGKRKDALVNKEVVSFHYESDNRDIKTGADGNTLAKAHDELDVAFQYNDSYRESLYSFVNNINTIDGGTHVTGFRTGLLQVLNTYGAQLGLVKEDAPLTQDDIKEGLVAVISLKFMEPQFEGQTKGKLGSSAARGFVKDATVDFVSRYFDQNPEEAKIIIDKCAKAMRAREEARKARERERNRKSTKEVPLSGKLAACSDRDATKCEIYLVEGDSAGGSAKQGRNRHTQAILPLRGKILNVEKATEDKILQNQEIRTMIAAFGCGCGEEYNEKKLNYNKIIIMTDADVDGSHIRVLLLTFLYRYMPRLIEDGHVYIAQPPLFLIKKGNSHWYTYSDAEQTAKLEELRKAGGGEVTVQRYKGLGEMNPEQLYETTMDPETRTIIQCTIKDAEDADGIFSLLMGERVEPRRDYIVDNAHKVYNLDF